MASIRRQILTKIVGKNVEAFVAYFDVLSRNMAGGLKKTSGKTVDILSGIQNRHLLNVYQTLRRSSKFVPDFFKIWNQFQKRLLKGKALLATDREGP
jgi:catalase (peroxidase I)